LKQSHLKYDNLTMLQIIKYCQFTELSENQSIEVINKILLKRISRSTYYYYKKKLYEENKFPAEKRSIYKSKELRCLLLYIDEINDPDGYEISKLISEQFPDKQHAFQITEKHFDKSSKLYNK
jgi:hypothetical protein